MKSERKWTLLSCVCLTLCDLMDDAVLGILQARILKRVAFSFSRGSSQPGIKFRSPALQVDSLPAEPKGKSKNTGVGSLSLLHLRDWSRVSCIAGRFFTNWTMREVHILEYYAAIKNNTQNYKTWNKVCIMESSKSRIRLYIPNVLNYNIYIYIYIYI